MDSLQSLIKKAQTFKEEGYSEKEIADELNVTHQTAKWLIARATKGIGDRPPVDASVGWRSVGVFPHRLASMADIMTDVAAEEANLAEVDSVVGIPVAAVPLATLVAQNMGKELIIFKFPEMEVDDPVEEPSAPSGTIYSNFAKVHGKKVIVVDDVLGTGNTMRLVLGSLRKQGAEPVLAMVMVNKNPEDAISGVTLRGLFRVKVIG